MYKKIIWLILLQLCIKSIYSQNGNNSDCPNCKNSTIVELRHQLVTQIANAIRLKAGKECDKKIVRVNIYYIQDNAGQKNFSPTGDGSGNSYNGKDFAYDMIGYVNKYYEFNKKLKLPPNNNISVIPKDIRFNIEGIYYIQNSALNPVSDRLQNIDGSWTNFQTANYNNLLPLRQAPLDSVIHIFVQGVGNNAIFDSITMSWDMRSGYGGSGVSFGDIITVGTYGRYWALRNNINEGDKWDWLWGAEGGLWELNLHTH